MSDKMRRLSSTSSSSAGEGKKENGLDEVQAPKMLGINESKEDRRSRMRSLYIVHSGMFIFMLGYSIIITGVYPYMQQLLPSEDEDSLVTKYGWVVASNPLGQLLMSPILGWASERFMGGKVGPACMFTSATYMIGNALYSCLSLFPESARYALLMLSRFIVGCSAANAAPMRAYVSAATYQHERTFHMSILSAAQSLGMIIGPSIQAALTPIQCSETALDDPESTYIAFDMYTACGWVSVLMGFFSLLVFTPWVFKEWDVATEEREATLAKMASLKGRLPDPDKLVVYAQILCFFFFYFNFVIIETLGTPMTMDEFAWSETDAVLYLGIAMTAGGALALAAFIAVGKLTQKYDERKLLIICGIIPMILARVLTLPWPGGPDIQMAEEKTTTSTTLAPSVRNVDCGDDGDPLGCSKDWCEDQPGLYEAQFFTAFFINFVAYPFCIAISQSLFSKALGPRPQGVWMGILTSAGSSARVLGPIMVSYVYDEYGVYLTFGLIIISMCLSLGINLILYKRMVPLKLPDMDVGKGPESGSDDGQSDTMSAKDLAANLDRRRDSLGFTYD